MKPNESARRAGTSTLAACGLGAIVLLGACASAPPAPVLALQSAEQAIASADRARVSDQAAPELHEARDKLAAARVAVTQERMVQAEQLAQESRADAELASARSEAAKAAAVNQDMVRGDAALEVELQRKAGAPQ